MISRWARAHKWYFALAMMLGPLSVLAYWVMNRQPPVSMDMSNFVIPKAHPGEEFEFRIPVKRETARDCSVRITRQIVDSQGARKEYGAAQEVSSDAIKLRENLSPGLLIMKFNAPETAPSGIAHVLTDSAYTCPSNPTTLVQPIRMSFDWPVEILPAQPKSAIIILGKDPQ